MTRKTENALTEIANLVNKRMMWHMFNIVGMCSCIATPIYAFFIGSPITLLGIIDCVAFVGLCFAQYGIYLNYNCRINNLLDSMVHIGVLNEHR